MHASLGTGLMIAGLVLLPGLALAQATAAPPASVPVPNLSLDQARQAGAGKLVRVVGYVVGSYFCPPCPPGASCKPCAAPSEVFIATAPSHLRVVLLDPASDVVAIAADKPDEFIPGVQYRFELTTLDRKSDEIDGRLIRSQKADEAPWPDASTEQPGVVPKKP